MKLDESIELKNLKIKKNNINEMKQTHRISISEMRDKMRNLMTNEGASSCLYEVLSMEGFLPETLSEGETYEGALEPMMEDDDIMLEMYKSCSMNESSCGMKLQEYLDEELSGDQDKIDMNHNGEIDSEDFKILRTSKKDIEEMGGELTSLGGLSRVGGKFDPDSISDEEFDSFMGDMRESKIVMKKSMIEDYTRGYEMGLDENDGDSEIDEKTKQIIYNFIEKKLKEGIESRKLARAILNHFVKITMGVGLSDLADTSIVANASDEIQDMIESGDYTGIPQFAKDAADEIAEDEGFPMGLDETMNYPVKGKNVDSENAKNSKENQQFTVDAQKSQKTVQQKVDNLKSQKHKLNNWEEDVDENLHGFRNNLDLDYRTEVGDDFKQRVKKDAEGKAPKDHANVDHESKGGEKLVKSAKKRAEDDFINKDDYSSSHDRTAIEKGNQYEKTGVFNENTQLQEQLEKIKKIITY